jgi:hypothetical protein
MFFEVFGVLLAASIEGLIISLYTDKNPCNDLPRLNLNYNYSNISTSTIQPKNKIAGEEYLISAGIMSIIYIVCSSTTFFGTKEIKGFNYFYIFILFLLLCTIE